MSSRLKTIYNEEIKNSLQEKMKYKSSMEVPSITKITINVGLGQAVKDKKVVERAIGDIEKIAGQKVVVTKAKKSIANFGLREGMPIGCKVTLRSQKMFDFLTKLINVSLPKIRDFRGVPKKSFDGQGNYTLGIKDDSIFPEVVFDSIDKTRGFDITFVTSAKTDKEAYDLLELFGFPFRKDN